MTRGRDGVINYVLCQRAPTAFCEYRSIGGFCAKIEPCQYKMFRVILKGRGFGKSLLRGVEGAALYNEEDIDNG